MDRAISVLGVLGWRSGGEGEETKDGETGVAVGDE